MAVDPTSGTSVQKPQHIEKPKFYGEMAKRETPMFELRDMYKEFVKPTVNGEYLNREQEARMEKAFNNAFKSLMNKLSDEEKAAFKEDPVGFLKAHPEYTKPSIEAVQGEQTAQPAADSGAEEDTKPKTEN